MHTLATTTKV